ncbi:MAG TPA: alpha/beta fold hydrolase [Rudaea sp.]
MVAVAPPVQTVPEAPIARVERLRSADGVPIAIETFGDANAPAVIFAHGFGQTRQAWSASANTLAARGWKCVTTDARGHGDSGRRAPGEYGFPQFVDDLCAIAQAVGGNEKPVLIGASMGGLLGIAAQAEYDLFRALVLVDITPRWETAGIERILTFMRAHPDGFATLDEAADAIAQYLPHRAERKSPERLRPLLTPQANGRLRWHWDPHLLDYVVANGPAQQEQLIASARTIRVPTLLVSGTRSDIVSEATIAEFLAMVPHAQHVRVENATHMVAGDRNDAFTAAVAGFLETLRA